MANAAPRQPGTGAGAPSRRALVALAAAVLLVVCACALLLRGQFDQSSPESAARSFFEALRQHDFQSASDLLTVSARAEWARRGSGTGEQNFAQFAGSLDRIYGDIRRYGVGPVRVSGTRASTLVTVWRAGASPEIDLLVLMRSGSGWGVATFSPGVPAGG
ncbi:MAG TPA: hypothetical protein VGR57_05360 [Ktedonobacterales bacterium]|nr:hypothetical protein [Ktedonobacterales bacterium]